MDLIKRLKEKEAARQAAKAEANDGAPAPEQPPAKPSVLAGSKKQVQEEPPADPAPEPTAIPQRSTGLSMPGGPVRRKIIGKPAPMAAPEPVSDDNAEPPTENEVTLAETQELVEVSTAEEKPKGPSLPGVLGKMQGNALARAKPSTTKPAQAAASEGERYTAEQMLADLQAEDDMAWTDEDDPDEAAKRDEARANILRKGTATITQIFEEELAGLEMTQASDYALKEMSQIVKLTFLRVKSAPNAYALMSLEERAPLIRAMRAMAEKRASATRSRKAAEAKEISAGYEDMLEAVGGNNNEDLAALMDGFDLGV